MKSGLFIIVVLLVMSGQLLAEAPPSFGEYWNSLSVNERVTFLSGYRSGFAQCLSGITDILELPLTDSASEQIMQLLRDYYIDDEYIDFMTLSKTITNLYGNPANSYVELPEMISIAKYKIKGESIENRLLDARKRALLEHELLLELKKRN